MKLRKKNISVLSLVMIMSSLHAGDIEHKLGVTSDAFTIDKGVTELMRVNGDGNVSIGTTAAASKLTVLGLPDSTTVTGNKLGGRSIKITDNGSFYIPSVEAPTGYGVIYAGGHAWLDKNLGATTVANAWDDQAASTLGDLYQWGRAKDGHQIRTSLEDAKNTNCSTVDISTSVKFTLTDMKPFNWRASNANCIGDTGSTNFWSSPGVITNNDVCPVGWRVPSEQDMADLDIESAEDAYEKINLTATGYRDMSNGSVNDVGISGYYWTSSVDGVRSRRFGIKSGGMSFYSGPRAYGFSVRCVKHLD